MNEKKKKLGQVFTPDWIVKLILDRSEYSGNKILDKYIFEPGCGSGNFLLQIVERFIETAKQSGIDNNKIKKKIKKYIYGIEIDESAYKECLNRLDNLAKSYNLQNIKWNIQNKDILGIEISELPSFDFVVGNPPYVSMPNLDKNKLTEIRSRFYFCKKGYINLFQVFFEIGILSLNKKSGKLGFITPNNFIHSFSCGNLRKYLVDHKLIKDIINFKENAVFDDASTSTAITILDTKHNSTIFDYYEYIDKKLTLINKIDLTSQDLKKWNFTDNKNLEFLNNIKNSKYKISDFAVVRYGFKTSMDRAYIIEDNTPFSFSDKEQGILHPVVKGSRYKGNKITDKIIYPYFLKDKKWIPIPEEYLKKKYPKTYKYLLNNKDAFKKRSLSKSVKFWYEYASSQGIQTNHNEKLVIGQIFKNEINVFKVSKETMVYSGICLFIKENSKYNLDDFIKVIKSENFLKYAKIVGEDLHGGYKEIYTQAIKDYVF